jgi:hypothetical protein
MTPVGGAFQPKRNDLLPWLIGGAAALVVALVGLGAAGLLRLHGGSGSANLREKGALAGADLRAQAGGGAPLNVERKEMPQDVYDWLKHLEKCEKMKQEIAAHQMDELTVDKNRMGAAEGMTPGDVQKLSSPEGGVDLPEGLQKAFSDFANLDQEWTKLKDFFDSKPPPAECVKIGQAYDNALDGILGAIGQVKSMVGQFGDPNQAQTDPSAAQTTKDLHDVSRHHVTNVDDQLQLTDDLVGDICKKYDVMKWFKIDVHGGGMNPLAGLGGG